MADKSFEQFYEETVREAGTGKFAAATVDANFDFCSIWPVAKSALEYLATVVPFWARLIIQAAIKYGDHRCSQ